MSDDWYIQYNYIANRDPLTGRPTGEEPGWIAVTVRASGEVRCSYWPAPLPSVRKGATDHRLRVPKERAAELHRLLVASEYERETGEQVLGMGADEPIIVGLGSAGKEPRRRTFLPTRLPRGLRPFLREMTRLVLETLRAPA